MVFSLCVSASPNNNNFSRVIIQFFIRKNERAALDFFKLTASIVLHSIKLHICIFSSIYYINRQILRTPKSNLNSQF